MSFGKFLPVAVMVGVFAFLYIWLGALRGIVLWVPFFTWALYYATGPNQTTRLRRLPKNIIGVIGGTIYAIAFIALIPTFTGWGLSLPVALGLLGFLAASTIVLLELTNWFEYATSYFVAFAGYFAYAFGGGAGAKLGAYQQATGFDFGAIIPNFISYFALLLVGYALGFVTAWLREIILAAEGVPPEQRETVFDIEKRQAMQQPK